MWSTDVHRHGEHPPSRLARIDGGGLLADAHDAVLLGIGPSGMKGERRRGCFSFSVGIVNQQGNDGLTSGVVFTAGTAPVDRVPMAPEG
jgi:hypothetical protein